MKPSLENGGVKSSCLANHAKQRVAIPRNVPKHHANRKATRPHDRQARKATSKNAPCKEMVFPLSYRTYWRMVVPRQPKSSILHQPPKFVLRNFVYTAMPRACFVSFVQPNLHFNTFTIFTILLPCTLSLKHF